MTALDPGSERYRKGNRANHRAEHEPHKLTDEDLEYLPSAKILELGNAGKLTHLGIGGKRRR